jgi:hypothetical protein
VEANQPYAVLAGSGKVRIMRFGEDGTFTLESVFDFRAWYANRTLTETKAKKTKKGNATEAVETPYSDIWITHDDRRQYEGIVFDPRGGKTRAFNMWRGFSVRANRFLGSCDRFLEHLRVNVCGGNEEHFRWLLGWLAHLVQRPWEKPGVAVVLKGAKGVGKSIVGEILRELLKHHTVAVSQPRHLVGNFNSHLARAVLVLVEEAFWAGDRTAEGALKDQITGATIRVERKGFDVEELPSFHRYMITGNAEWIVPATHDDRRYAVFDVGDARQQDHEFFGAMMKEMREGGYEALMHHLRTFDLGRVDLRTAPRTEGLAQQKIENLHNVQLWWSDVLTKGELPGAEGDWSEESIEVETDELRRSYEYWHTRRRFQGEVAGERAFGRDLRAMCPNARNVQRRIKREKMRFYRLPSLETCRADFVQWLGVDCLDWERL